MTGDYTSVPLRPGARWTGARMQQGRVLLDGDYNLTVDAASREAQRLTAAAVGPAGVADGSSAFRIGFATDGTLQIGAGEMWIGGLRAVNSTLIAYTIQESVPPLPTSGKALLYLDAFVEEIQAAENPPDLLDPALDGIDTMTRTRVGWRVRAKPVNATSCAGAAQALPPLELSTGLLDIVRTSPPVPMDPCAPPDDPRGKLPDGLLRVEVLDSGTESTARFAWSYENAAAAVSASVVGAAATLKPSPEVTFVSDDLVEVSTLVRRADRVNHGPLFVVDHVQPGAGGSLVTLKTPAAVTGSPSGLCLRRWDGQSIGAAAQTKALLNGVDVGVAFRARPGSYLAGDWWAVRVRGSSADAVEELSAAPADGTRHFVQSLAVVDLDARQVLTDCRPTFPALTALKDTTCTVTAFPGDDLQVAADKLPDSGGELCLAAGLYPLNNPVIIKGKRRIVVAGIGPATVLACTGHESVVQFHGCSDITVRDLRAESGLASTPERPAGDEHLLGTLSFIDSSDVTVRDCELACPDSAGRTQSTVFAGSFERGRSTGQVRVLNNRLEVGNQQTGVLVVSPDEVTVTGNEIRLGPATDDRVGFHPRLVNELSRFVGSHVVANDSESGHTISLPGGATMRVAGATVVQRLAGQFARTVTEKALSRGTPRQQLQQFTRRALLAPDSLDLSREANRFLTGAVRSRSMSQGIVVAGLRANHVRIEGNQVSGVLQGIHVGLAGSGDATADAGQVVINGNHVACAVPFFWTRSRHAYYVGSVQSLTLTQNSASLTRIGAALSLLGSIAGSPVEAVRIHGRLGYLIRVQGLDLTGPFAAGVAITDLSAWGKTPRLFHVSDVINMSGTGPALVPLSIPHDRCVP
ncbi:DUF6519 domain-containing protein [Micromonospora sp. DR5-3]|uniref:DUF6519 domain-containing protein n=1 Tax=unclassified Micromonospora TaxID=2617518 RepID=UPI0011D7E0E0|nr:MULTISPECIES: DUF6519 domain-containing protein [unclassified Micromonospora]MCW3819198.1 DUF6519 domain-containing protein [Micromonospora sp. DR5-3]TYC20728.1 hypothetical protein FXF52_29655 [Micromonospora sp. MP36]